MHAIGKLFLLAGTISLPASFADVMRFPEAGGALRTYVQDRLTSSPGIPSSTQSRCLGPVVNERIPLTCEQAWAWHLMLKLVLMDFAIRDEILEAGERHALDGQKMFEAAVTVGETLSSILPKEAIAAARRKHGERFIDNALRELSLNAIKEGPWFALGLFERRESSPRHDEIANAVLNTVRDMYDAAITGGLEPWHTAWEALGVWNDSVALFQIVSVVRSRQTLHLVREFLWKYFVQGGNMELIARSLGLPADASIEQVVKAMGSLRKWNWLDYSAASAVEMIQSYRATVHYWAAWCVRIGVETGMCSAPAMRSYEPGTAQRTTPTPSEKFGQQKERFSEPKVPAPLTTKDLILREYRAPNGSSRVVRNGKALSIELTDKYGVHSRYDAATVRSESEVWDLVFVDQYYVRPPSEQFMERYKNYGRMVVVGRYLSFCPASRNTADTAMCIRDELARRNHVTID